MVRKPMNLQTHHWIVIALFVLFASAMGFVVYEGQKRMEALGTDINRLSTHMAVLESGLSSTETLLQNAIATTKSDFSSALQQEQQRVQEQFGNVQNQVGEISGTVSTLEKLTKTDPELLQKYSKVFFLSENYVPARLVEIPEQYKYSDNKAQLVQEQVWPYLQNMLDAAKLNGVDLYVLSGYRSFAEQQGLKSQYSVIYGEGTANQFSADQGYSEHQLGSAVDLTVTGVGASLIGFEKTPAYNWLKENAYTYGFILSYPEGNSYYVFEPWHWRYVGEKLATDLHNAGKHFYDLDQREIDTYLADVFL